MPDFGWFLLFFLGPFALLLPLAVLQRRHRQRLERRRMLTAPIAELLHLVRDSLRSSGLDSFPAGRRLVERDVRSDAELMDLLDQLWREVGDDDRLHGRSGRDSRAFEYYDCGIAQVVWLLKDRLAFEPHRA